MRCLWPTLWTPRRSRFFSVCREKKAAWGNMHRSFLSADLFNLIISNTPSYTGGSRYVWYVFVCVFVLTCSQQVGFRPQVGPWRSCRAVWSVRCEAAGWWASGNTRPTWSVWFLSTSGCRPTEALRTQNTSAEPDKHGHHGKRYTINNTASTDACRQTQICRIIMNWIKCNQYHLKHHNKTKEDKKSR